MIEVTTQEQLDAALKKTNDGRTEVVCCIGDGEFRITGSSTVSAYDSSRVYAYGSSRVRAEEHVAVYINGTRTSITGGVQITPPEPKTLTPVEAVERWRVDTDGTTVRLFKAVNNDLKSERGFAYPIGETVECADWDSTPKCGGGLHLSPTPHHATRY